MREVIKFNQVEEKILTIRNQNVILDSDVASLYGVETREINQAIKNNPDKFPEGYIIRLNKEEWINLKSKILTSSWGGKNKLPNVFTEK
ncbi:MAG: ORF6N domain-containing protein [Candidatus Azobacteroides sp.]|nr:ORF6N domain-containing protein [Candidatus Azobacteroides sp.]